MDGSELNEFVFLFAEVMDYAFLRTSVGHRTSLHEAFNRPGYPAPPGHGGEGQEGEARGAGPAPRKLGCVSADSFPQRIGNRDGCMELAPAYPALHLWKEACRARHESAQVQFAAYKQFCDDTTVEKQRAIKEANAKMEQLSAAIQKATAHWQRGHRLRLGQAWNVFSKI